MSPYKIGDQVVCTRKDSSWWKEQGIVESINGEYLVIDFEFKDGTLRSRSLVNLHECHVALAPKAKPEPKFKVGDKVRCTNDRSSFFEGYIEKIHPSISWGNDTYVYRIQIPEALNVLYYYEEHIELVEKADPYAELKQAYVDGRCIQAKDTGGKWGYIDHPSWCLPPESYRVEPEDGGMKVGHLDVIAAKAGVGKSFVMNVTKPTNKETKMKFETKHYLNGNDISLISNSRIYELIAEEEYAIKELKKIDTKPKRLNAEITKRTEELNRLVNFLNEQDGEA